MKKKSAKITGSEGAQFQSHNIIKKKRSASISERTPGKEDGERKKRVRPRGRSRSSPKNHITKKTAMDPRKKVLKRNHKSIFKRKKEMAARENA